MNATIGKVERWQGDMVFPSDENVESHGSVKMETERELTIKERARARAFGCVLQEHSSFELSYVSRTLFKSRPLLPTTPLKSGCFLHEGPSVSLKSPDLDLQKGDRARIHDNWRSRTRTSTGLGCVIQEHSSFELNYGLHTFTSRLLLSTTPLKAGVFT